MAEQLYNQFADISALEAQRDTILKQIFGKIKEGVVDLSKTTFKIDGASSAADLKKVLEELKVKEKELAEQSKKLAETQSQMALLMQQTASGVKGQAEGFKGLSDQLQVNIQRQIQLKDRLADIKEALGKLDEFREAAKDSAQFNEEIVKLTAEQAQLKQELSATNKLINNQAKEFNAAAGSIDEQRAKINQLTQVYDALSDSQRQLPEGKALLAQIKNLDVELKKLEGDTGRFQRNVGNYAGSLSSAFDKVTAEIKRVNDERKRVEDEFKNRPRIPGFQTAAQINEDPRFKELSAQLQQLQEVQQSGFKVTSNYTQQVRQLENAYISLATSGQVSNEFLEEFKNSIGNVKDDVNDLRASIKLAASDTRALDVLIGSAQAVAGAFGIAQGFAAAFGDENEDLQKTLVKLNGVMTILNGLQAIQNELKKKDNLLTIIQTGLQKAYAVVVGTSTGAMKAFRIALAATGIGAAIILIGYLIKKYYDLNNATGEAARKQKLIADVYKEASKSIGEAFVKLESYKKTLTNLSISESQRLKTLRAYNDTADETNKIDEKQINNLDLINERIASQNELILKRALSLAATAKLGDFASEFIKSQLDIGLVAQKTGLSVDNLISEATALKKTFDELFKTNKKDLEGNIELTSKDEKAYNNLFETKAKNLGLTRQELTQVLQLIPAYNKKKKALDEANDALAPLIITDGTDTKKELKKSTEALEDFAKDLAKIQADITKANFESLKQRRQDEITALEAITNDAKRGYYERYAASQQFYDRSKELIDLNVAYEIEAQKKATEEEKRQVELKLKNPNLTIKQRADLNATLKALHEKLLSEEQAIRTKYATVSIALDTNSEKQRTDIHQSESDRRKKIFEDEQKFRDEHTRSGHEIDLQQIQNDFDAASNLLDQRFADGLISEKKYNRDKLRLEAERQTATIESEVNTTVALIEEQEKRFKIDEAELQHKIDMAKGDAALEKDPAAKKDQLDRIAEAEKALAQIKVANNDVVAQSAAKLNSLLIKLNSIRIDIFKKGNKDIKDDVVKTFTDIAEAAKLSFDLIGGLISASADRQKNEIQEQIDLLEKKKQVEIEAVNQGIGSAEEKAAKIKIIEARSEAERQQLELKKRQADEKRARFEKAATISQIILSTALAVVKAFTEGDPYTKAARAIAAGVIGAAQLAVAIATPIPKFEEGKNIPLSKQQRDNYAGPAIVGDGGKKEIIIREDGKVELTPATPTLTKVKKKDIILPDAKKAMPSILEKMRPLPMYKTGKHVQEFEKFKESIKESIVTNNVDSSSITEKDRKTIHGNPPSPQIKSKEPTRSEPKKADATIIESVIPMAISNNTPGDHVIHISKIKIIKGASPVSTTYSDNENTNTRVNKPVYNYTSLSELANLKDQTTYNISNDMIRANELERKIMMNSFNGNVNVPAGPDYSDELKQQTKILKRLESKSRIIIQNNTPIETTGWYQLHFKS